MSAWILNGTFLLYRLVQINFPPFYRLVQIIFPPFLQCRDTNKLAIREGGCWLGSLGSGILVGKRYFEVLQNVDLDNT